MENKLITLSDGCKIYTASSITNKTKTIMIIHGGPGNGFFDQLPIMEKLAKDYNVIGFDERGVNKSDEIKEDFTSERLIDDIEEIRKIFSIDKINLIGHSYGGHLLLRYCLKYPKHIDSAIFECPSFNLLDSFHEVISRAYKILENSEFDKLDELAKCLQANSFEEVFPGLLMIPEDVQNTVYGYDKIDSDFFSQVFANAPNELERQKSAKHQEAVFSENELRKDCTSLLKDLKVKSMLLIGDEDPVCTDLQRSAYNQYTNGKIIAIKNSGHFPYLDSIDETIAAIEKFVD